MVAHSWSVGPGLDNILGSPDASGQHPRCAPRFLRGRHIEKCGIMVLQYPIIKSLTMTGVLNISDAASLGLHAIVYLARCPERVIPTHEVASELGVSEAHLAKVFQRLAKVGLLTSRRGPRGGFLLARRSDQISLLEVYEAIDGPLAAGDCLAGTPICDGRQCIFGDLLSKLHNQIRRHFASTKLSKAATVYARKNKRSP